VKLKGGCLHHDNGLLGAAAFTPAEYRRVALMKRNGFNANSHQPIIRPPAPSSTPAIASACS